MQVKLKTLWKEEWAVKSGSFLPISTSGYTLSTFHIENIFASLSKWIHSSMQVYPVRILDSHYVQLMLVDAKVKSSVLLEEEDNRWGSLLLDGFDSVHDEHSMYFWHLEFPFLGPCSVWGCVSCSGIRLLKSDSVLHRPYRKKVSVLHAFQ